MDKRSKLKLVRELGYHGGTQWDDVKKTPEALAIRLMELEKHEKEVKYNVEKALAEDMAVNQDKYDYISNIDSETNVHRDILNASIPGERHFGETLDQYQKRMHETYQQARDASIAKQTESKAQSDRRVEAELATMNLGSYDHSPLPRQMQEILQREDGE